MRRLPRLRLWISPERRAQVYAEIEGFATPSWSYYVRVALSTTIATYGLLANSTAVIIGAMLIAPLMGPIFGVALGLASGDHRLLRMASLSEALGALLAFGIAALLGLVPLNLGLGSEVLSRTQPTLYDLIVALASGVAGAYAIVDERLSATLPGVAISTALVPPLATAGLCLAGGHPEWALGATLLFLANFVAIEIASAGVFIAHRLPRANVSGHAGLGLFLRRFGLSLAVLIAVGAFMTRALARLIEERRLSAGIEAVLREQVRRASGATLSSVEVARGGGGDGTTVVATALTPQEFQPEDVAQIEEVLNSRVQPGLHLVLRSLISKDFDRDGPVYLPAAARERRAAVERQTDLLRTATSVLDEQLAGVPGARLAELRREGDGEPVRLFALVRSPRAIDPGQVARMQAKLGEALGSPAALTVRTLLARDADAARFIYDEAERAEAPQPQDLERRRRIEQILRTGLAAARGVSLLQVQEFAEGGRTLVHAELRSPQPLQPEDVARVEATLRREVSPAMDLVVRYQLGADITANGLAVLREGEVPRIPPVWESDAIREGLRFASGSARLSARARAALDRAAPALAAASAAPVVITGYSDDRGSPLQNGAIALARARAVQRALVRRGVPAARTRVEALGERDPVASNASALGRARNRRVELRLAAQP